MDGERGRSWPHISAGNEDNSNNYGVAVPKTSRLTDLVLGNEDVLQTSADFAQ